jgi:MATE family multidrug resistance protein
VTQEGPRPVVADLVRLAWPITVSRSTQATVGVCDALLVGHLGASALSATSDGSLAALMLLALPMGVVSVASSFSSQLGAADPAAARRFGVYGLALAAATQILAVALLPAIPWALGTIHATHAVRELMAAYLRVRLCSAGAAVGLEALGGYYCGRGRTGVPMLASVAALALNVAGNWLLIDGRCGFPALGVTGSALASTLATTVAFAGLLAVFVRERHADGAPALSVRELRRMVRLGLPAGANVALEAFTFTFFVNVVVASFGTVTLAAFLIVLQIATFAGLPAFAVASAGSVLVGQAVGACARDGVPRILRSTLAVAAGWQGLVAVAYALGGRGALAAFVGGAPDGPAIVEAGAPLLVLSAAWTLFEAQAATYAEALAAAGDTAVTMRARAVLVTLVLAPGAFVLVHTLQAGPVTLTLWFIACAALLTGVLRHAFRGGAWQRLRLRET